MISFYIKNTRVEEDKLVVFYEFSNGEVNSHAFDSSASVGDITSWGQDRADWFTSREAELRRLAEEAASLTPETEDQDGSTDL